MKRDYVEEILSKKERVKYNERDHILWHRTGALDCVVEHCKKIIDINGLPNKSYFKQDSEIHKYIPIGAIACVESYFRSAVRELIDFGLPYSENATNLREIKFDFSIVQAVAGKQLTVGDFLSHLIPMKSFEDVNSTIGTLAQKDFLYELKGFFFSKDDFEEGERQFYLPNELSADMQKEIAEIYDGVKETFRFRNIFCHEPTESSFVNISAIYKGYESTCRFLVASNEFIWELIEPNRPTCNVEISWKLSKHLETLKEDLSNLTKSVADVSGEFGKDVIDVNNLWENYKNQRVELVAKVWEGGSGQGIAMLNEEIYLTKNRINEIKEDIKNGFYDVSET